MKVHGLLVFLIVTGLAMFQSGCRTTCLEVYAPKPATPYQSCDKILGLPPLVSGVQLDDATLVKVEKELDKMLSQHWGERYVSHSQDKQSCQELLAKWTTHMACDYDLAVRLRVNASLCQELFKATGCRYAIMPTIGRCSSDAVNILNYIYVIPAVMVIIYGNIPIYLGKYLADDMSVCTATIIDLKEARVMSDAAMAERGKAGGAEFSYPSALLNSIARSSRVKQEKK